MELGLKDKVAIITGGGQGIGRIMVKTFAQEGAKVIIADINKDNADNVAKEVQGMGGEAVAVKTDVSKLEDTDNLFSAATDKFGSVEAVINASIDDLQSISGIGKHTAEEIKWVVMEQAADYSTADEFHI